MVLQQCHWLIQTVDVGVDHIFEGLKAPSLLRDHGSDGVLHRGGDTVRKYRDKFHPEISCAPKGNTTKYSMKVIGGNIFKFLIHLDMDCFNLYTLGGSCGSGSSCGTAQGGRGAFMTRNEQVSTTQTTSLQ